MRRWLGRPRSFQPDIGSNLAFLHDQDPKPTSVLCSRIPDPKRTSELSTRYPAKTNRTPTLKAASTARRSLVRLAKLSGVCSWARTGHDANAVMTASVASASQGKTSRVSEVISVPRNHFNGIAGTPCSPTRFLRTPAVRRSADCRVYSGLVLSSARRAASIAASRVTSLPRSATLLM